jgi:hypothetical protein
VKRLKSRITRYVEQVAQSTFEDNSFRMAFIQKEKIRKRVKVRGFKPLVSTGSGV